MAEPRHRYSLEELLNETPPGWIKGVSGAHPNIRITYTRVTPGVWVFVESLRGPWKITGWNASPGHQINLNELMTKISVPDPYAAMAAADDYIDKHG